MNKFFTSCVLFATAFTMGLTSCDNDKDDNDLDFSDIKDLVSANFPSEGWSGNGDNGILTYAPDAFDEEDLNGYFAFEMANGICRSAVYNIVTPNSNIASQIAKMLNDGTWTSIEDDEEDYSILSRSSNAMPVFNLAARAMTHVSRADLSLESLNLPIPVRQSGKVIYVEIKNISGISKSDIRTVMNVWTGQSMTIPDRVLFGKYEDGVYTCSNMQGLNIEYIITTKFNAQDYCTKYTTKMTLPTKNWAQFNYEIYKQQVDELEAEFGQRPDLRLNDKTITLDAVIINDVPRSFVEQLIYTLDWMNNCPFVYSIFE